MKELEILFTKSKKMFPIGSLLIRWWTKQPYSHVVRGLTLYNDVKLYYQSNESKVNYECEQVFNEKHDIVKKYVLCIPEDIYHKVGKACVSQSGKPYGLLQNLGIFLVDLRVFKGNPWKKGLNCSELLYLTVFKELCPELDYNPDTIKPQDIENIILTKCLEICKK